MNVLITSGGTKIPIDGVRDITNMSSGTFGCKIAKEFMALGHKVCFFHAKDSKTPFKFELNFSEALMNNFRAKLLLEEFIDHLHHYRGSYKEEKFRNFDDYQSGLFDLLRNDNFDIVVLAAAVSDYGVQPVEGKIRSSSDLQIELSPLPKVISEIKKEFPNICLVGFKLLVNSTKEELHAAIENSIEKNQCDLVVGNDLRDLKAGNHTVHLGSKRTGEISIYEGQLARNVASRAIEERNFQIYVNF